MTQEAPRPSPSQDLPQLLSRFDRLLDDLDALIEEARARPSTEDRLTELYSAITAASDAAVCPVSQQMISSTSALVRFFRSALLI